MLNILFHERHNHQQHHLSHGPENCIVIIIIVIIIRILMISIVMFTLIIVIINIVVGAKKADFVLDPSAIYWSHGIRCVVAGVAP